MPSLNKVVIYGVGLIGGSFAAALRQAEAVGEIVGVGRTPRSLQKALSLGLIDRGVVDPSADLADADLVLLATPVAQIPACLEQMVPYLGKDTVVTDAGSTKGDVVAAARRLLKERIGQFVPAHPIAGAENSGPEAARPELYRQRRVVITPLEENTDEMLDRVKLAWSLCGAELHELTPETHDRIFAGVSHLPHLLSFALVHDLTERNEADLYFDYAASGFRDFTRIAASHPEMWRDICLANRSALIDELDSYLAELQALRTLLQANDGRGLETVFARARHARRAWSETHGRRFAEGGALES